MKSCLVLAGTVLGLSGGVASAANLLVNPGFEDATLSPWYQSVDFGGPEDWNVTTVDTHSGLYSATDSGAKLIVQDFAAVPVGDILQLSFWLKNVNASINDVFLRYSDSSFEYNVVSPTTGAWELVDATGWLDPGKSLVSFGVSGISNGRSYIDDCVLNVVPEPADGAMIAGLGLVGFGLYRRSSVRRR